MLTLVAFIDWFIAPRVRDEGGDELRRARLVAAFGWTLFVLAVIFAAVHFSMGCSFSASVYIIGACVGLSSLYILRQTGSCFAAGTVLTAVFFGVLTVAACRSGGHDSPSLPWYAALPVVALLAVGRRSAVTWFISTSLSLAAFYALDSVGYTFPNDLNSEQYALIVLLSMVCLTVLMFSIALLYETGKNQALVELRNTEARLQREKDLSDSVIASLPGMFYLFDSDGNLLQWNENFEQVSGYSREVLSQMHPLDFFRGHDRDLVQRRMVEVFKTGQSGTEAYFTPKNENAIPYVFTSRRVVIDGKMHLVGLGIDITERKQIEAELASARDVAQTANQTKSDFLANMSHEIRTPMTAILGFSEAMMASELDREQRDAVATIIRNGEYLLRIINDILDLSKIEAGKMQTDRIPCSPCQILSDVASLMRVRTNAKKLPLEVQFDGPMPQTIQSDPIRLRQILINLTSNAVKFTESGKVRLMARLLDARSENPKLQVEVVDSGIGMSAAQTAKLFKPFSQVDSSTTRQYEGTGLGLAISKRLAEELGGNITVETALGKGSTFTLTVSTGSLEGVKLLDDPSQTLLPGNPPSQPATLHDRLDYRVLLAEDGPDNQRLITLLLKAEGIDVVVADNGQVAHELALVARDEGRPFDVILMDMQMPVMDGYEATRKLREAGYTGPIIAVTAHAMSTDREKCFASGCDDYMAKPIDRQKLIDLVRQYAASPSGKRTSPLC